MALPRNLTSQSATLASGASLTSAINIAGFQIVGFLTDAAWTAAAITMQASSDAANYSEALLSTGAAFELGASTSIGSSRYVAVGSGVIDTSGAVQIKLRSGTSGSPVTQTASTTLTVLLQPV